MGIKPNSRVDKRGQIYFFDGSIPLSLVPKESVDPELARRIKVVDAAKGIVKGAPSSYGELKNKHGLALNLSGYEDRPGQISFLDRFFEDKGNEILEAPTGTGKTYVALAAGSKTLFSGGRVLFLAPSIFIVAQSLKTAQRVINLAPEEMVAITGEESPEKREKKYYNGALPKLICATPDVILNDFKNSRLKPEDFGLVIFDEVHWALGEAAYVHIARAIDPTRARAPRILCCSATVATKNERLQELSTLFRAEKVTRISGTQSAKVHTTVQLANYPTHKRAMEYLDQAGHGIAAEVQHLLPAEFEEKLGALLVRQDGAALKRCLPPRKELLMLINDLQHFRDQQLSGDELKERASGAVTKLFHLLEIIRFKDLIGSYGSFMFLDTMARHFSELWADRHKLDFKCPKKRSSPSFRIRNLRELCKDGSLLAAFHTLAAGTAYADFYNGLKTSKNWNDLLSQAGLEVEPNQDPLKAWPRYRAMLRDRLVQSPRFDHVKEERLILELIKRKRLNGTVGVLVFDDFRDHAVFLSQRIEYLSKMHGEPLKAGYLLGGNRTVSERTRAFSTTEAIKRGAIDVLITTSAGEEGIHIPDVSQAYAFSPTTQGIRVIQRVGRVGRTGQGIGELVHLLAEDTGEQIAFFVGQASKSRAAKILDNLSS